LKSINIIADEILQYTNKAIRAERIALNLTQKEFANLIGITYPTYRNFEQKNKISYDNFILILIKLNKNDEFLKFLKGFDIINSKQRARIDIPNPYTKIIDPIISISQKQITLDKNIFGNELFYSVENGHLYEVSNFITIMLNNYNDKRLSLLLRYFGDERLKPFILKQKNLDLLKKFNTHIKYMKEL